MRNMLLCRRDELARTERTDGKMGKAREEMFSRPNQ